MFASTYVSGRTDASMLVPGRWSWGITGSIQVMFLLFPCVQLLEQYRFGTAVLERIRELGLMKMLTGQQVPALGVLTGFVCFQGSCRTPPLGANNLSVATSLSEQADQDVEGKLAVNRSRAVDKQGEETRALQAQV